MYSEGVILKSLSSVPSCFNYDVALVHTGRKDLYALILERHKTLQKESTKALGEDRNER